MNSASPAQNTNEPAEGGQALSRAELVKRGEYLARAANCAFCHHSPRSGDLPFSGGFVVSLPIGNIVAGNITPSKGFGIGTYTKEDFRRAVREGLAPDGRALYPVMPYISYRGLTDEDTDALYTYFMYGVKPSKREVKPADLGFPYNMRSLVRFFTLAFVEKPSAVKFQFDEEMKEDVQRGAYLVDVLGHCSMCHSPRSFFLAEQNNNAYLSGGRIGSWYAPNITPHKTNGIGGWSEGEIVRYLKTGNVPHKAQASGEMGRAVQDSLRYLDDEDLEAIARYLKAIPAVETFKRDKAAYAFAATPAVQDPTALDIEQSRGAKLYATSCSVCHRANGEGAYDGYFPSLTHNSTVGALYPDNLVMVILEGVNRKSDNAPVMMPAFGQALEDNDVAELTNYVIARFGDGQTRVTARDVAGLRRGGGAPLIVRLMPYMVVGGVAIASVVMVFLWRRFRRPLMK